MIVTAVSSAYVTLVRATAWTDTMVRNVKNPLALKDVVATENVIKSTESICVPARKDGTVLHVILPHVTARMRVLVRTSTVNRYVIALNTLRVNVAKSKSAIRNVPRMRYVEINSACVQKDIVVLHVMSSFVSEDANTESV